MIEYSTTDFFSSKLRNIFPVAFDSSHDTDEWKMCDALINKADELMSICLQNDPVGLIGRLYSPLGFEKIYYKKPNTNHLCYKIFITGAILIYFLSYGKSNEARTFVVENLISRFELRDDKEELRFDLSTVEYTPSLIDFILYVWSAINLNVARNKRRAMLEICGRCEDVGLKLSMGTGASDDALLRDEILLVLMNERIVKRPVCPDQKDNSNTLLKEKRKISPTDACSKKMRVSNKVLDCSCLSSDSAVSCVSIVDGFVGQSFVEMTELQTFDTIVSVVEPEGGVFIPDFVGIDCSYAEYISCDVIEDACWECDDVEPIFGCDVEEECVLEQYLESCLSLTDLKSYLSLPDLEAVWDVDSEDVLDLDDDCCLL